MSFLVLATIAISSSCSLLGTLNLSRVLRKSATIACHCASLMLSCACASFIDRPEYLQGPPVTSQTSAVTWNFNPAFGTRVRASLIAGFPFKVSFTSRRSMKSSTTVAMLYTPPSRSNNGFDLSCANTACTAEAAMATVNAAANRRVAIQVIPSLLAGRAFVESHLKAGSRWDSCLHRSVAKIRGTDCIGVRRPRRNLSEHLTDERLTLFDVKRPIESSLEPDSRRGFAAQVPTANRSGKCARPYFDVIRECAQTSGAFEQGASSLLSARRQFRPSHVAGHQRVSREDHPGFGCARAIGDGKTDVFGGVAGRMNDANRDVSDDQFLVVLERGGSHHGGGLMHEIGGVNGCGEGASARQVIGVHMRVNDCDDACAGLVTRLLIGLDVLERVDDHRLSPTCTSEQIRGGDR